MSNSTALVAAIVAVKSNTRLSLATSLVEANATIAALRFDLSVAQMPKAQTPARAAYLARPRSTEPSPFQLACAKAKAAAMAGGKCITVSH